MAVSIVHSPLLLRSVVGRWKGVGFPQETSKCLLTHGITKRLDPSVPTFRGLLGTHRWNALWTSQLLSDLACVPLSFSPRPRAVMTHDPRFQADMAGGWEWGWALQRLC